MRRSMFAAMIAALAVLPASAQVFNPNTPAVPSGPLPPTPPAATPGMAAPPPVIGQSSATDQGAARPSIKQGRASRETVNDRAIRCAHQGAALGVPPGRQGQYIRECVND